jgi:mono/diheme cytochrome c family protein
MNSSLPQAVSGTDTATERRVTFPIWLILLIALAIYLGGIYFDEQGGWFSPKVYAPYRSEEEAAKWNIGGPEDPLAAGRAVYAKSCFACHQTSGLGLPGQYPPLAGSEWVNEQEPGRIIRIVLKGIAQSPITVKGQTFNNTMTAWSGIITDEEIAAVITFVRGNAEWGNHAPPVTVAQVKAIKDKIASHPGQYTADELLKISPAE